MEDKEVRIIEIPKKISRLGLETIQFLQLWSMTNARFWVSKRPDAQSNCTQIQIVGLLWGF